MALEPKFSIAEDLVNGDKLRFTDVTGAYASGTNEGGYGGGGNPPQSDIKATRIVVGDAVKRRNINEGIGDTSNLTLYREYTHGGSFLYAYLGGSGINPLTPFILPHDPSNVGLGSDTVDETGRDLVRKDYLPPNGSVDFSTGDFNISENTFPDRVYDLSYEVYVERGTSYSDATSFNVVAGNQYIVIPDSESDTAELLVLNNGQSLFRYQVFTPDKNQTISPKNSAKVYELEASVTNYFNTRYETAGLFLNLSKEIVANCHLEQRYKEEIEKFFLDYEAYKNSINPNCMPNISGTQDLVDRMKNHYNWLIKCVS